MATENFFDGAAFGYASRAPAKPGEHAARGLRAGGEGHHDELLGPVWPHQRRLHRVHRPSRARTSYHGSGYGYFADDTFNAKGFFAVGKTPLSNNNYGATLGGPVVIPKLYRRAQQDVLLRQLRLHEAPLRRAAGFRQHDAHGRVQGRRFQRAADWQSDRRRRARAARFSPARFSIRRRRAWSTASRSATLSGQRQIPGNDPLRSLVAAKVAALMVHPDRAGIANNVAGNPAGDQTWELERAEHRWARLDHNFTPNFRDEPQLLLEPPPVDPQLRRGRRVHRPSSMAKPSRRRTPTITATGSSSASPRMHAAPAVRLGHQEQPAESHDGRLRPVVHGRELPVGRRGWPQRLWGANQGGILDNTAGPPLMNFAGNIPYNQHRAVLAGPASGSW